MAGPRLINRHRCRRLIEGAIESLSLDLSGLVVLTEAASGNFSLTPMIAALAGADRVIALGRDSRYGTFPEIGRAITDLSSAWNVGDRLILIDDREDPAIEQADVVTNLGFVRPLSAEFLARLKSTAALSLMWETWEFRAQDLDLGACRRLGLPVLGTNEDHPELRTLSYLGHVAIKLLFERDVEVFRSRLILLGTGKFAEAIRVVLLAAGARSVDWILPSREMSRLDCWHSADAIVIAEHEITDCLLGSTGWLDPEWLMAKNSALGVAHICGSVDEASLMRSRLKYVPTPIAKPGFMSVTTDYVGPKPLIDLHAAGLKVGEQLARCRLRGLLASDAEAHVLRNCALAQGFESAHAPEPRSAPPEAD